MANRNDSPSGSWEDEKREFSRQILQESLAFIRRDNEIMGSFASITGSLARYLEEHPSSVADLLSGRGGVSSEGLAEGDLAGGSPGILDDLLSFLREIIVKDKDFFLKLISTALGI